MGERILTKTQIEYIRRNAAQRLRGKANQRELELCATLAYYADRLAAAKNALIHAANHEYEIKAPNCTSTRQLARDWLTHQEKP